ncbi:MAG TPA: TolC family protein [Janthinobacterium sp.]|nr:TolC family protein [Janthinobacterium sp.]
MIRSIACTAFLLLSGCAGYEAPALKDDAASPDLMHLTIDARAMPLPALAAHRFDPSDGLDMTEVAMLAVVNNPDLKLARGDAAIAHAQAFSAGLLPDPQLALAHDWSNTGPDGIRAFSLGLNYDVNALLLHSSVEAAAQSDRRKTDLNLLWQEWQVVSQARLLFVKARQAKKAMAVLEQTQALFADRLRRTRTALERGLLSSDAVAPNVAALQDTQRQVFDLKRTSSQSAHDLNALLGLAPETQLDLRDGGEGAAPDQAAILAALPQLARRRPDLLALQAGYQAQDQRYRGALLAQFPALNLGLVRARDSSGIYSNSVGVTMSLPFLNRNRGNIAIEQATRQRLADEYRQRLQTGRNDIHRLLDEQALNLQQLAQSDAAIAELEQVLARSEMGFKAANIDALVYAGARAALLSRQLERITLEQAVQEQRIALQTLIGISLLPLSTQESLKE